MYERWVGDWTNCNILTPSSFVFSSTSFSFCLAAEWGGVLRAHSPLLGAHSIYSILSPTNWLQLTELPVAPGYTIVYVHLLPSERRICTQFNPSTVKVIPWYLRPDAPVSRFTARPNVNMLHSLSLSFSLTCHLQNTGSRNSTVKQQMPHNNADISSFILVLVDRNLHTSQTTSHQRRDTWPTNYTPRTLMLSFYYTFRNSTRKTISR